MVVQQKQAVAGTGFRSPIAASAGLASHDQLQDSGAVTVDELVDVTCDLGIFRRFDLETPTSGQKPFVVSLEFYDPTLVNQHRLEKPVAIVEAAVDQIAPGHAVGAHIAVEGCCDEFGHSRPLFECTNETARFRSGLFQFLQRH